MSIPKRTTGQAPQAKNRPKRVPIGQRNRLSLGGVVIPKGMVPRIFNDVDDRITGALEAGYQFIMSNGKLGDERCADPSKMGSFVTKSVGGGRIGYLMAIPEVYYKEDQAAKQKAVDESELAMKAPKPGTKLAEDAHGTVYGEGLTDT